MRYSSRFIFLKKIFHWFLERKEGRGERKKHPSAATYSKHGVSLDSKITSTKHKKYQKIARIISWKGTGSADFGVMRDVYESKTVVTRAQGEGEMGSWWQSVTWVQEHQRRHSGGTAQWWGLVSG